MHNFLKKYKNSPTEVKSAMWYTVCKVMQNGISLVTLPIFTRMLTTQQYGLSTLFFSWYEIVAIFTSLRLALGVFNNGMVHFENDRDRFQSSMQGLSTTSTLLLFIVYMVFSDQINTLFGLPSILMIYMFVQCMFQPAFMYWIARQRYEYKYRNFTIVSAGMLVISSVASIAFVLLSENKGVMKIIGYVISYSIVCMVFYAYNFIKGKAFFDKKYWLYALKFNIPLLPHYLSMIVLNQSDRIMIANMCGTSDAALYGVAYRVGTIALFITGGITASFTPWIYNKLKTKEYQDCSRVSNLLFVLVAGVSIFVMLFGPEIILVFASAKYSEAISVISPVAASMFFIFIYNQVATVEFFYGNTTYIMFASIIGAIANIILNIFAIRRFGFIAAAYTTLICYILFAIFHFHVMKTICNKNGINVELFPRKKIAILAAVIIAAALLSNVLYVNNLIRYGLIVIIITLAIWKRNYFITTINSIKQ